MYQKLFYDEDLLDNEFTIKNVCKFVQLLGKNWYRFEWILFWYLRFCYGNKENHLKIKFIVMFSYVKTFNLYLIYF